MQLDERILSYKKNNVAVSIYNDRDPEQFFVGNIMSVNSRHCFLHTMTPEGRDDGYLLLELEEIFAITSESSYIQSIMYLYDKYENEKLPDIVLNEENFVFDFLKKTKEKEWLVEIFLLGSSTVSFQGIVVDVTPEKCTLLQITDQGKEDGNCVILINTITEIIANNEHGRKLLRLYKRK